MYLKKVFNKGFSLPELLVGMGLMGGISIIAMKLIETQRSNENLVKANGEISKAVSMIQAALNNQDKCKIMLNNVVRSASQTAGTPIASLRVPIMHDGTLIKSQILLRQGTNYGLYRLKTGDIQLASSTFLMSNAALADIIINFRVKKGKFFTWGESNLDSDPNFDKNYSLKKVRIPVVVTLDGSNRVTSCGPTVSDANITAREKFCQSLGAGVATWTGTTCTLKSLDCGWGQIPTALNFTDPTTPVTCTWIENVIDLTTIFDLSPGCPVSSGVYGIEVGTTGRLRLKCIW